MHFQNENAVQQIEVSEEGTILTSKDQPTNGESMLYDQSLSDLELSEEDYISKDEFMKAWNENI